MGVRLRPLREDEFEDWLSRSREGYAREMVESGGFPEPEAREKARGDFAGLLGDGLETPGHAVFALEDDSSGEHVGDRKPAWRRARHGPPACRLRRAQARGLDACRGRRASYGRKQIAEFGLTLPALTRPAA